jgi:hypothetical protein
VDRSLPGVPEVLPPPGVPAHPEVLEAQHHRCLPSTPGVPEDR